MGSPKPHYDAEFEVRFMLENGGTVDFHGSKLTLPPERKFGDLEGLERYVAEVYAFLGEDNPPRVRPRKGEAHAHYEPATHTIAVPLHRGSQHSWAMREIVILHEVAHALVPWHDHDSIFCSKLVELVTKCISPEVGLLLAAAFGERGILICTPSQ